MFRIQSVLNVPQLQIRAFLLLKDAQKEQNKKELTWDIFYISATRERLNVIKKVGQK